MKINKLLIILYLVLLPLVSIAQSGNWVWLKGADTMGSKGNYGTLGVSSPSNEPPARYQAAYWTDLNGNFWLFGGVGDLNDLWKYNPISNEWTWVKGPTLSTSMSGFYGTMGVPSVLNNPPALGYGANCWTDNIGDLWLFAGYNLSGGVSNDVLWRYHIASNEWTWMKGDNLVTNPPNYGTKGILAPTNTPGSRYECKSAWVYNNKLWLYGGQVVAGNKNDLWSYDIATNNWTWESGTTLLDDIGNFGTKGVATTTNVPPSRWSYTRWVDAINNFYIFGGGDIETSIIYNDVWQYSTTSKLWTWVSGTNKINDSGTINPFCTPNVNNIPTSRSENQSAQTNSLCTKGFWTFGGISRFYKGIRVTFNDLWLFNTENFEWTKVKGGWGTPPPFSYGTKGVTSTSNLPPGKFGSCVWTDKAGTFFVFGGLEEDGFYYKLSNDLWKFIPDIACFKTGLVGGVELIEPLDTVLCNGDTIKVPIPPNCTVKVQPIIGNNINLVSGFIEFYSTVATKYTVIASSLNPDYPCPKQDTISFTIKAYPPPKADFTISPLKDYINNPTFNCLNTSTDAVRYEWYYKGSLISTSKDIVYNFPTVGMHCLTLVAINKCEQRDSVTKCCYVIDTTKLRPMPDTTICIGDTVLMNLPIGIKIKVSPYAHFIWDSLLHNIKFFPAATTRYTLTTLQTIPNDSGFITEVVSFTIRVLPLPKAIVTIYPVFTFIDKPFYFTNQSTGAVRYEWYYNGQLISKDKDIAKTFPEIGEYCLTLVAINQCEQRDSVTQCCKVYKKGKLVVPNTFTPNGDGKNDGFRAILIGPYQSYQLLMVNRWGEAIFSTEDPKQAWDGTFNGQEEAVGVYYYLIKVKFDYPDAVEEMYKGDISLIR